MSTSMQDSDREWMRDEDGAKFYWLDGKRVYRPVKTLRPGVPLLDVAVGDYIEIGTTLAYDPQTGEQVSLERSDARIVTGPVSGDVVSIKPINPTGPQGFEIVLDQDGDRTTVLTSRYNTDVRLLSS